MLPWKFTEVRTVEAGEILLILHKIRFELFVGGFVAMIDIHEIQDFHLNSNTKQTIHSIYLLYSLH